MRRPFGTADQDRGLEIEGITFEAVEMCRVCQALETPAHDRSVQILSSPSGTASKSRHSAIGRLDLATGGHARAHRPGTIESVADSIRCNPLDLVAD